MMMLRLARCCPFIGWSLIALNSLKAAHYLYVHNFGQNPNDPYCLKSPSLEYHSYPLNYLSLNLTNYLEYPVVFNSRKCHLAYMAHYAIDLPVHIQFPTPPGTR